MQEDIGGGIGGDRDGKKGEVAVEKEKEKEKEE